MSEHRTAATGHRVSAWAPGLVTFAGAVMIIIGVFHAIAGIAAIFEDEFFVVTQNYLFDLDVTAWGWMQLLLGVIVFFAGWGIFSGATWARVTGMVLVTLSAIANFFFIPYYPVWAVLIIALDIAVIWALTVWDRDTASAY
ncbi:MAG TPA: hypothetical protein VFM13_13310 [Gaiellaceae bacterium]|nr:hypothetical protein [Gaiellaceae bacterium]